MGTIDKEVEQQITVRNDSRFRGNDSNDKKTKNAEAKKTTPSGKPDRGAHRLAPYADSCGLFAAQLTLHRRGITATTHNKNPLIQILK
jgi:hypothetical protein